MSEVLEFPKPMSPESEDEVKPGPAEAKIEFARVIPTEYVTAELPQTVPSEILLGALRDGRLRVVSPIHVRVSTENDDFILEAVEIGEFGFGKNLSEATADLQHAIAELYFRLESDQDRLGPDLHNVWQKLGQMLRRIAP